MDKRRVYFHTGIMVLLITILFFLSQLIQIGFSATSISIPSYPDLSISYTNGLWTYDSANLILTGSATGKDKEGCSSATSETSTLTFTNSKNVSATLSFNYEKPTLGTGGSVKVDGGAVTTAGSFEKEIASGGSVNIVILSGNAGNITSSIVLNGISFKSDAIGQVTFLQPQGSGTYTINQIEYSNYQNPGTEANYELLAIPNDGNELKGWYVNGVLRTVENPFTFSTDVNATVYAAFIKTGSAIFKVGNNEYSDLEEAVGDSSSSTIIVVKSGKVFKKNVSAETPDYTIPSKKTLLVPYNASYTLCTNETFNDNESMATKESTSSIFTELILEENVIIKVLGKISLGSQINLSSKGQAGPYGLITMNENSFINLESGAFLYAFGYVKGSGAINAKAGSKVYEFMAINDYPGSASKAAGIASQKVFPFSKFEVKNVQCKMKIMKGCQEYILANIWGSSVGYYTIWISIFGNSSDFAFEISDHIIKSFSNNRQYIDVCGNLSINPISAQLGSVSLATSDTNGLPIPYNYTINVKTGTTTCNENVIFTEGSIINVDKNGLVNIPSGKNIYLMDGDDDNNGKTAIDATLDLNGRLIVNGGFYTSTNHAEIKTSLGSGQIVFNVAAKSNTKIKKKNENDSTMEINVTPAYLKNGDNTFTATAGATSGTTYYYCKECNKPQGVWETGHTYVVTFNKNGGTGTMSNQNVTKNENNEYKFSLPACGFTAPTGKQFKCWSINNTEYSVDTEITVSGNITVKAIWEDIVEQVFNVTYHANNGTSDTLLKENIPLGNYTLENVPASFVAPSGKEFEGWSYTNDGEIISGSTIRIERDTDLYAKWKDITYTITFDANGGTGLMNSLEVAPNFVYTLPECGFVPTNGKKFKLWKIGELEKNPTETITITGDITIKAIWGDIYTLTLIDDNQHLEKEIKYTVWIDSDRTITLPDNNTAIGDGLDNDPNNIIKAYLDDNEVLAYKCGDTITLTGDLVLHVFRGGFVKINQDGDQNYIDPSAATYDEGMAKGAYYVNGRGISLFDADGIYQNKVRDVPFIDYLTGEVYYNILGYAMPLQGLTKIDNEYYYFGENYYAYRNGSYYLSENLNNLLCPGVYTFDSEGKIVKFDDDSNNYNGEIYIKNGYALIDGIAVPYGLFKYQNNYYYATDDGSLLKDAPIYITTEKANGLLSVGEYYFNSEGKMLDENFEVKVDA